MTQSQVAMISTTGTGIASRIRKDLKTNFKKILTFTPGITFWLGFVVDTDLKFHEFIAETR
jgi:hypothetical protein